MSRLGIRHRLLLVVVATVGLAVAVLVLGFNLILARTLTHNSRDLVRTHATAELALLTSGTRQAQSSRGTRRGARRPLHLGVRKRNRARATSLRASRLRCGARTDSGGCALRGRPRHRRPPLRNAGDLGRPPRRNRRRSGLARSLRTDAAARVDRLARAGRAHARRRRPRRALAARSVPAAGRADDSPGGGRGASTTSTAGSPSASRTTSWASSRPRSTAFSTGSLPAFAGSSVSRRSSRTSCGHP